MPHSPSQPPKFDVRGYQLKEALGQGGFGAVYRAYQPVVERDVAIKIILPQYANQPDFIRRFEVEAQLIARLEHLHIVPLYDYWRDPDGAYLVMRWLRGGSLRMTLNQGPLSVQQTAQILAQVGAALATAHRNDIIHQDIKPENILIDSDGNAFLSDFGIARIHDNADSPIDNQGTYGSPAYMSPESLTYKPTSPLSDIYSLGIMIYELVTGVRPFDGKDIIEVIRKQVSDPLPSVTTLRPELTPKLDSVLWKATAKAPQARYQNLEAFIEEFQQAADVQPALSTTHPPISALELSAANQDRTLILDTAPVRNPYKGLRPFEEADAVNFFGRDGLIDALLLRLKETPFLALIGPSGSGKSSVIKAGIIPVLRRGRVLDSERWFYASMTPGSQPLAELRQALLRLVTDSALVEFPPDDLDSLAKIGTRAYQASGADIFLFIDQFEELFTQVESESERLYFLNNLLHAVRNPDSHIRVILTLRADFYDRPLLYPGFGELLRTTTEVILPPAPQELGRMIVGPAERARTTVEAVLVASIISDVTQQPGALPLLQYTLTELFEGRNSNALSLAEYEALGGISGALARRAELFYEACTPDEQQLVRTLFLRLVSPNENGAVTRRRVQRGELLTLHPDKPLTETLLNQLNIARLLTFDHEPHTRLPTVEVAHEALLHAWSRLVGWIEAGRESLATQRLLAESANEWAESDHDSSFLARGARLASFESLLNDGALPLAERETAFLGASLTAQRRSKRLSQGIIAALTLLTVAALILAAFSLDRQNRATAERDRADQEARLSRSRELAVNALTVLDEQPDLSLLLSLEAERAAETFEAQNSLLTALERESRTLAYLHGHTDAIRTLALNSAGTMLVSGGRDGRLIRWDMAQKTMLGDPNTGHTGPINAALFSPDGSLIASGGADGRVRLWDAETGGSVGDPLDTDGAAIWSLAFSQDGDTLAAGSADGMIWLWGVQSGDVLGDPIQAHEDIVYSLLFVDDKLISGGGDNLIRRWNLADSTSEGDPLSGHTGWVMDLALSPDGALLASTGSDLSVRLWDTESWTLADSFSTDASAMLRSVTFDADGTGLMVAGDDGNLTFWTLDGDPAGQPLTSPSAIWDMAFSGTDGVIAAHEGAKLILWAAQPADVTRIAALDVGINDLAYANDQFAAAVGLSSDYALQLWPSQGGEASAILDDQRGSVTSTAYNQDGSQVASGSADGTILIWDIQTAPPAPLHTLNQGAIVRTVAFNPRGDRLAAGGDDGKIILWDTESGQAIRTLEGHSDWVQTLAFSPDGRWLVSGSYDQTLILWDATTGQAMRTLEGHTDVVQAVRFSPDGTQFASAGRDGAIRLWTLENSESYSLLGHASWVNDVAFSPDGALLVSGGANGELMLWDRATLRPLGMPFTLHSKEISRVIFVSGAVYSAGMDGQILRWQVSPQIWRSRACEIANRDLTPAEWAQYFPNQADHAICE